MLIHRVVPFLLLALGVACTTAAPEDTSASSSSGAVGARCLTDDDCQSRACVEAMCVIRTAVHSSSSRGPASSSASASGGASSSTADGGMPAGVLTADPAVGPVELGAVRLGVAVEKIILLNNTGDAAFNVVQAGVRSLEGSDVSGFTVEPSAALPSALAPQGQMSIRLRFTPSSAASVRAMLSVVTTSANAPLFELEVVAAFKGSPELTVHGDLADEGPALTALNLGAAPLGQSVMAVLYVKNTGAAGSALSVDSVTLEPAATNAFAVTAGTLPAAI